MSARLGRVRRNWLIVAQASLAAGLAWLLATQALGHDKPFFAPVSAILVIGFSFGQRARRAAEIVVGVALGILVADAIVLGVGTGAWQLGVVIALAMAAALLLGSGPLLATQAAASAALVVTLQPPGSGLSGDRFVDALVGGGVALVIGSLVLPTDPIALVRRAAGPVLHELAATLEDVAGALEARDRDAVVAALLRARAIDDAAFAEAVTEGRDTARTAMPRRGALEPLEAYAEAAAQVDLAIRNVRGLARACLRAVELEDAVPPGAPQSIRSLAEAVRSLHGEIEGRDGAAEARAAATLAAAQATAVLEETANLSISVIVGHVRSTAVDILRGLGDSPTEARRAVRQGGAV